MQRLFDFFSSTRRPAAGTPVEPVDVVRARLLDLNRPTAPFQIVEGSGEGADLVAEWKIVDARWHSVFSQAGLEKVFRVFLKLDPDKHEVRALDQEYTIAWNAGIPSLSLAAEAFRGQKQKVEFGGAYAFTETTPDGVVYKYRFNTRELKGPIQEEVTACGWTYRGVAFGKF